MTEIIPDKCVCGGAMRLVRWPIGFNDNESYKVECSKDCGTSVDGLRDWEKTKKAWNEAQGPL